MCPLRAGNARHAAGDGLRCTHRFFIFKIAQGYGTAELSKDSVGDPMISGRMAGINYVIFFYGCNDAGKECSSLQFRAA